MKLLSCAMLLCALCCLHSADGKAFAAPQTTGKPKPGKPAKPQSRTKANRNADATNKGTLNQFKPTPQVAEAITKLKADFAKEIALRERNIQSLNADLQKKRDLFNQGIIAKKVVDEEEAQLNAVRAELEARRKKVEGEIETANNVAAEVAAAEQLAKMPLRGRRYIATNALICYNGSMAWGISDITKVSAFFVSTFNQALPISAFGQTAVHNQLGFDHSNSVDVALHPDSPQGQALINYLRNAGIPFLAFPQAVPGSATGAHIHIGYPSHRLIR